MGFRGPHIPSLKQEQQQVQGKRKLSPFLIYVRHRRPIIEQERMAMSCGQYDMNMKEVLHIMAQEWHALTEEQK